VKTPSSAVLTVRHRPPPKRRRRFRPALGRTAFSRPVPVLGEDGRTGRLRTLCLRSLIVLSKRATRPYIYGILGMVAALPPPLVKKNPKPQNPRYPASSQLVHITSSQPRASPLRLHPASAELARPDYVQPAESQPVQPAKSYCVQPAESQPVQIASS